MIDSRSEQELVGGGDTLLHYHLADRATNAGLQSDQRVISVTEAAYSVSYTDDVLLVDTTASDVTVQLLPTRKQREIEIVKVAQANTLTILPASNELIVGESSAIVTEQWTALHFKGINQNWVVI